MAKGPLVAALVLALSSPVVAGSGHPRLPAPAPPRTSPARTAPGPTAAAPDSAQPSFFSRAVTAVRLFDLHRGREALDPAATARERGTDAP